MHNIVRAIAVIAGCLGPLSDAIAVDYAYKTVKDFKTLEEAGSVQEFEAPYAEYTQHCLDNTFGGTGGIPCYIGDELWDRELNIYYKKLMATLDAPGKQLLKKSQQEWLKSVDLAHQVAAHVLNLKYTGLGGTLTLLIRAGLGEKAREDTLKERTLWLKNWLEVLSSPREE